ncbi:AMP-binding protein [Streptomyces goshikiensis]|uniref:AMP-binding protein n=1 Tax=Streptomyces goshikiensis TaxID=1942 RepID=UPI003717F697
MTNIATLLTGSASAHGDRIAIRHEATALTYAQLDELTARTAALLQERGVRPGDRVAVIAPNVPHFPIAYYGILRAGAVVVPMNPLLKAPEIAFILRDAGARTVLTSPMSAAETAEAAAATETDCLVLDPDGFDALLDRIEPVDAVFDAQDTDLAVILYTSGTTGTPKGAELTHRNLLSTRVRSRRSCTGTRRSARPPSSAYRTRGWGRRSQRWWSSSPKGGPRPRRSATT